MKKRKQHRKKVNSDPIYGLYSNVDHEETLVLVGSLDDIAEFTGLKRHTVMCALCPSRLGDLCYHKYRVRYLYDEKKEGVKHINPKEEPKTKVCKVCGEEKSIRAFYKHSGGYGRVYMCKKCCSKYYGIKKELLKMKEEIIMYYEDILKEFANSYDLEWEVTYSAAANCILFIFKKTDGKKAEIRVDKDEISKNLSTGEANGPFIKSVIMSAKQELGLTDKDIIRKGNK